MAILAADGAGCHAEASVVLHVVREAGAGVGSRAESVDALGAADGVAETEVMDVADVARTAGFDTAEVGT